MNNQELVKRLQHGHGEWASEMAVVCKWISLLSIILGCVFLVCIWQSTSDKPLVLLFFFLGGGRGRGLYAILISN